MLSTYSKIHSLGHRALEDLLSDPVVVEEKVDGSQFGFGIHSGELKCRSRGANVSPVAPDKMFARAVETVQELAPALRDGWTYRGEYLQKPKHNTLAYDRCPAKHIVLFDIDAGDQRFLGPEEKAAEAARLGLEVVPCLHTGTVNSAADVLGFLERVSFLGGQKIEGVVIKNYSRFTPDGKAMMGKYVSEAFKEINRHDFRERNPSQGDIKDRLIDRFKTPARWNKAIQHLAEDGRLANEPRDIGLLIPEIQRDIEEECGEEIREFLYTWAIAHLKRGVVAGFAEYYKQKLLEAQFETTLDADYAAEENERGVAL